MTCPKVVLTNVGILQYCAQVTDPEPRLAGSFGRSYFQSLKKKNEVELSNVENVSTQKFVNLDLLQYWSKFRAVPILIVGDLPKLVESSVPRDNFHTN